MDPVLGDVYRVVIMSSGNGGSESDSFSHKLDLLPPARNKKLVAEQNVESLKEALDEAKADKKKAEKIEAGNKRKLEGLDSQLKKAKQMLDDNKTKLTSTAISMLESSMEDVEALRGQQGDITKDSGVIGAQLKNAVQLATNLVKQMDKHQNAR